MPHSILFTFFLFAQEQSVPFNTLYRWPRLLSSAKQKTQKEKTLIIFIGMMKTVHANVKIMIFTASCSIGAAILTPLSAQGIKIIEDRNEHQQQVLRDISYGMVELKSLMPTLVYDIRYATAINFTGKQLYQKGNKTFLRRPAALALQKVQASLAKQRLGLKIWDAYRPYAVTEMMWHLVQDERYVANPAKGSGHNRGLAVDVTVIDLKTGKELDMGTGYDNFSDTAHLTFTNLSPAALHNRKLLQKEMEAAGFTALPTEWWHFYWPNDKGYEVLNLSFRQLAKLKKPKGK